MGELAKVKMSGLFKSLVLLVTTGLMSVASASELKVGTNLVVGLSDKITHENYMKTHRFYVENEVIDPKTKQLIIAKGTPVIVDLDYQKGRTVGRPGHVEVKFLSTLGVDNQVIALKGGLEVKGEDKMSQTLGVGIGVGIFIWPMFFYLFAPGGHPEILPSNSIGIAEVTKDYIVSDK